MTAPHALGDDSRITYFGVTHTRGKKQMFGIRAIDRLKHMYVIGKTGVGKSTMLENMAIQDIQNGEGIVFVDPHGSSAEKLLDFVPQERIQDVIYFAPFDTEFPLAFNVMESVGYDKRHHVVSGLMGVFERLWADTWSARMQYILQNTLLALLEYPDSTLIDVNRMLINKKFREAVVEKITDPIVKSFWVEEFANYGDKYTQEATPAIQNKIGQFITNPLVRNIIGQPKSSFDFRKAMDERKIIIINLSKGRMGDSNTTMIGAMIVIRVYLAAMTRAEEAPEAMRRLPPCYFYVDEFQNVVNRAFANILSESRKYKLGLIIANQYIKQMDQKDDTSVKDAVFGNVGTTVVFRVGPLDAEVLEPLFAPTFTMEDLVGLGVGEIYLTLSIDGITSPPFSALTIPAIEAPEPSYRSQIIAYTREMYASSRAKADDFITKRQNAFPVEPPKKKNGFGNTNAHGSAYSNGPRGREQNTHETPRNHDVAPSRAPAEVLARRREDDHPPHNQHHNAEKPREQKAQPPVVARAAPNGAQQEKNALRDAIAAARGERAAGGVAPRAEEPGRSPVDILRERQSRTQHRHKEITQDKPSHTAPGHKEETGEIAPNELRRILKPDA